MKIYFYRKIANCNEIKLNSIQFNSRLKQQKTNRKNFFFDGI